MHEMQFCLETIDTNYLQCNIFPSYKPAVDDLWHPLSPAHGLPRILVLKKFLFSYRTRALPQVLTIVI